MLRLVSDRLEHPLTNALKLVALAKLKTGISCKFASKANIWNALVTLLVSILPIFVRLLQLEKAYCIFVTCEVPLILPISSKTVQLVNAPVKSVTFEEHWKLGTFFTKYFKAELEVEVSLAKVVPKYSSAPPPPPLEFFPNK